MIRMTSRSLVFAAALGWLMGAAFPAGTAAAESSEKQVSLNFHNADVDLVLKFFSEVTGLTFIRSDAVQGQLSVVSPDRVTVSEAMKILESLLEVKGYAMVRAGRVVKVLTQAEAVSRAVESGLDRKVLEGDQVVTQVIPLRFVSAAEAKGDLSPLMLKGGSIIAHDRTNTLVVTDVASNIRRLLSVLDALDVRTPQVLIDVLVAEVSLSDDLKLGLEWSHVANVGSPKDLTQTVQESFGLDKTVGVGLKYSVVSGDKAISATLQALEESRGVNILATPSVMAANNREALIRIGEEVPFLKDFRALGAGETLQSYDYRNVAIELIVTPRVTADREVALSIQQIVKKIVGQDPKLQVPILGTREAKTFAIVKDSQTMVIGGLMKDDVTTVHVGIPILKDIPLLGYLFRRTEKRREKTELLIFLTPRVVLTAEDAARITQEREAAVAMHLKQAGKALERSRKEKRR